MTTPTSPDLREAIARIILASNPPKGRANRVRNAVAKADEILTLLSSQGEPVAWLVRATVQQFDDHQWTVWLGTTRLAEFASAPAAHDVADKINNAFPHPAEQPPPRATVEGVGQIEADGLAALELLVVTVAMYDAQAAMNAEASVLKLIAALRGEVGGKDLAARVSPTADAATGASPAAGQGWQSENDIRDWINRIRGKDSLRVWAMLRGLKPQQVDAFMRRARPLEPKLAKALDLEGRMFFRPTPIGGEAVRSPSSDDAQRSAPCIPDTASQDHDQSVSAATGPTATAGQWRCTRCGQSEITARQNGCTRGPCPMESV